MKENQSDTARALGHLGVRVKNLRSGVAVHEYNRSYLGG